MDYIPLEKPIADVEAKILSLRTAEETSGVSHQTEITRLEEEIGALRKQIFLNLTPYEVTQLSRHPKRPSTLEVAQQLGNFIELHGDRNFRDDPAIVCGLITIGRYRCALLGHQKGRDTKENIERNFGMPRPEGYRKALRIMSLAERCGLPIITLIDTPGAYPGIGAEERGQSEAIGKNIMVMSRLKVPIVSIVIGEGGSGGALALGVANRLHMLRNTVYSVISPEGCASILWKSASKAAAVADALKLTADSALELGVIDTIIDEPLGGAHLDPTLVIERIRDRILRDLDELSLLSGPKLAESRVEKFMKMGDRGLTSWVPVH